MEVDRRDGADQFAGRAGDAIAASIPVPRGNREIAQGRAADAADIGAAIPGELAGRARSMSVARFDGRAGWEIVHVVRPAVTSRSAIPRTVTGRWAICARGKPSPGR